MPNCGFGDDYVQSRFKVVISPAYKKLGTLRMSDGSIQQVVGPAHSLTSSPRYLTPTTSSITTVLRYRTPDLINIINRIIKPSPSCGHQLQLCRSLNTRPFLASSQPTKPYIAGTLYWLWKAACRKKTINQNMSQMLSPAMPLSQTYKSNTVIRQGASSHPLMLYPSLLHYSLHDNDLYYEIDIALGQERIVR